MASKAATLRQAYSELAKADAVGDNEKALRTCNRSELRAEQKKRNFHAVLKTNQFETKAFQCKIVCMIRLEQFEEVLSTLKKTQPSVVGDCVFEKAYAEYRLNRNDDALATLTANETDADPRRKELLAQLYYRQSRFADAHHIYSQLVKQHSDTVDSERYANMLAVESQLTNEHLTSIADATAHHKLDTYEQHYNRACALIAQEKYDKAIELLTRAEKMCRQELTSDNVGEDEIEDELALVRAQLAYAMQMSGKPMSQIVDLYARIVKSKPSDPIVNACVNVNAFTVKIDQTVFEARKRLKACAGQSVQAKLTARQKRSLAVNDALVLVNNSQFEQALSAADELAKSYGAVEQAILLKACVFLKQKENAKAVGLLKEYTKQYGSSERVNTVLAHCLALNGETGDAIKLLEANTSFKNSVALLSLRVAVLLASKKVDEAIKLLSDAASKQAPTSNALIEILEHVIQLCTQHEKFVDAAKYLEQLRRCRPEDGSIVARLIQMYARFDARKAEMLSREVPVVAASLAGYSAADLEKLESSEWLLLGERYKAKKEAKQQQTPNATLKRKRHRVRKNRMPKVLDPAYKADPERWLPKRERSTFKRRKDKRAKLDRDVGRGTQGASAASAEAAKALDASQRPTASATPSSPSSAARPSPAGAAATAAGPRQQRPGGAAVKAKPKKKGGKW